MLILMAIFRYALVALTVIVFVGAARSERWNSSVRRLLPRNARAKRAAHLARS